MTHQTSFDWVWPWLGLGLGLGLGIGLGVGLGLGLGLRLALANLDGGAALRVAAGEYGLLVRVGVRAGVKV